MVSTKRVYYDGYYSTEVVVMRKKGREWVVRGETLSVIRYGSFIDSV